VSYGLELRLERVEAQLAIQQLPARYAVAVDSRNLDDLVALFAVDVDCGRWGQGRDALKRYYASQHVLTGFYRSVHLICGQTVDLVDADHASGTVYCRAGHEAAVRGQIRIAQNAESKRQAKDRDPVGCALQ